MMRSRSAWEEELDGSGGMGGPAVVGGIYEQDFDRSRTLESFETGVRSREHDREEGCLVGKEKGRWRGKIEVPLTQKTIQKKGLLAESKTQSTMIRERERKACEDMRRMKRETMVTRRRPWKFNWAFSYWA